MRLDNNVNYNTKQSDVKSFKDFVPAEEEKDLKKYKRQGLKSEDDRYDLPNTNRLRYNKVTKTWQNLSKKQIDDKLKAAKKLEKINIKTFEEVINENGDNIQRGASPFRGLGDRTAFGKELNSETFLTDLERDIRKHKADMAKVMEINKGNIDIYNILLQINMDFDNILHNINDRHKESAIKHTKTGEDTYEVS